LAHRSSKPHPTQIMSCTGMHVGATYGGVGRFKTCAKRVVAIKADHSLRTDKFPPRVLKQGAEPPHQVLVQAVHHGAEQLLAVVLAAVAEVLARVHGRQAPQQVARVHVPALPQVQLPHQPPGRRTTCLLKGLQLFSLFQQMTSGFFYHKKQTHLFSILYSYQLFLCVYDRGARCSCIY